MVLLCISTWSGFSVMSLLVIVNDSFDFKSGDNIYTSTDVDVLDTTTECFSFPSDVNFTVFGVVLEYVQ